MSENQDRPGTTPEKPLALAIIGATGESYWLSVFTEGAGDVRYRMTEAQFWQLVSRVNDAAASLAKVKREQSQISYIKA